MILLSTRLQNYFRFFQRFVFFFSCGKKYIKNICTLNDIYSTTKFKSKDLILHAPAIFQLDGLRKFHLTFSHQMPNMMDIHKLIDTRCTYLSNFLYFMRFVLLNCFQKFRSVDSTIKKQQANI